MDRIFKEVRRVKGKQKKVALVSCYFQPNYGSMLQALATQEILDIMNVPNETICIDGLKKEIHDAKMRYFKSRMFSADVIKDKLGYLKLVAAQKLDKKLGKNIALRKKCFEAYSKSKFRVSRPYSSKAELSRHIDDYTAFLVGSDQLWLPSNIAADYYTLSFVPDEVRKIAYATSFGVSILPKEQAEAAKQFIPRIDHLSVREQSGQKLIKDLTGIDAKLVCDPTLLLTAGQWLDIVGEKRIIKEKYIFCYFLGNNPLSRACAKKLSKATGLKIVALQQLDMYIKEDAQFADIAPYDVDPAGFVDLIKNAEFVCTDSFHGTVFSVIFHRRFFSFRRFFKKSTMSTNSRIDSLLSVLGLEDRIIESVDAFKQQLRVAIDHDAVDGKLMEFRKDSMSFLETALEGIEKYDPDQLKN